MRTRPALLLAAFLPLSGCCSLARLFCGPDKSAWVSERFDTPGDTVATFLEAIRRDDPEVIKKSLAQELLQQHGLDSLTAHLAWQHLREQNPGLHLAGYAEVPPPLRSGPDAALFLLHAEGTRLRLDLVREAFVEVVWRRPDGTPGETLTPIAGLGARATVQAIDDADPEASRLVLAPLAFEHGSFAAVPIAWVERAGVLTRWKIRSLQVQPAR